MSIKEKVKEEIDRMPDELVEKVYKYIEEYLKNKNKKNIVSSYSLKGSFDKIIQGDIYPDTWGVRLVSCN